MKEARPHNTEQPGDHRERVYQGNGFIIVFAKDYWMAHNPDDNGSGFLLYNALTGTFHAWANEIQMLYPQLAKAPYKPPSDCPVDENHHPKSDFMILLALRKRANEYAPGSDFVARSNREMVFRLRRMEIENTTGNSLSDRNWAEYLRIAGDEEAFEKWAGQYLIRLLIEDDAAESFMRIGRWLKHAEKIESQELPPQYLRFFAAIEEAAKTAKRMVPFKKDVQAIYERGMSANELGAKTGFRAIMRRLNFEWLPSGGRGPSKQQKKSGGRKKN